MSRKRRGSRFWRGRPHVRRYLLLAAGGIIILAFAVAMSLHGSQSMRGVAEIHIAPGTSAADIARMLADNGVIDSAHDFMQRAQNDGAAADLKAGTYRFRRGEPVGNIINDLRQGKQAADRVLTVPEGYRISDIAALLASKSPISTQAYGAATAVNGRQLPLAGANNAPSLEGFLFPSTYNLDEDADAASLVKQQLDVFRESTAGLDWSGAAGQRTAPANLTPYQILIVASLVEREAKVSEERPLVAAVIYNRLASGMKLEVDATVQYALGNWKKDLTEKDLQIDSPYNTRLYPGLPPGPICNPGLESIKAALAPAKVNYLYYVAIGDAAGHHFFTADYNAFLRAKAGR